MKNTLSTVSKMMAITIGNRKATIAIEIGDRKAMIAIEIRDIFSNGDRDRDRDRNFRDRGHTLQRSQSKTQRFSLINRTFLVVMNFKPPHCHQEAACLQK